MSKGELACICKSCSNHWVVKIDLPMEMGLLGKKVRQLKCPGCDERSDNISFVFGNAAKAEGF